MVTEVVSTLRVGRSVPYSQTWRSTPKYSGDHWNYLQGLNRRVHLPPKYFPMSFILDNSSSCSRKKESCLNAQGLSLEVQASPCMPQGECPSLFAKYCKPDICLPPLTSVLPCMLFPWMWRPSTLWKLWVTLLYLAVGFGRLITVAINKFGYILLNQTHYVLQSCFYFQLSSVMTIH